jgi:hypothetical protein
VVTEPQAETPEPSMESAVTSEIAEAGYAMLRDAFNLNFSRSSPEELRLIVTAIYRAMEEERRRASKRAPTGEDQAGAAVFI